MAVYSTNTRERLPTRPRRLNNTLNRPPCTPPIIFSSTQSRVRSTEIKIARLEVITPIRRERNRLPTGALDRERGHENQQLGTSANSSTQNIVIFQEPLWVASADIELYVEAESEEDHDRGVDAHGEVAQIPGDDGCHDKVEADLGEVLVCIVERHGKDESEWEREHDPLVLTADAEEVA